MNIDPFDQYATLDPAETPEALPDWTAMAPVLLAEIDERTHPMQTNHRPNTTTESGGRWNGLFVAAAAFALVLIVGITIVLLNSRGDSLDVVAPVTTSTAAVAETAVGQTVGVTVSGVSGYEGQELAGVLYEGGELADLDSDAVGGFWWVVSGDESASMTEVVRKPGDLGVGRFPYVSDEALTVEPGLYTLVVWVDYGLNPVSRWVPINTDGMGLFGCQTTFEVGDDAQTDVVVSAGLEPNGWNTDCATGVAIPGTDDAAAVAPDDMWMPELATSMPPVVGVGGGQTVSVTVSDVSGRAGDELAGVLYEGGELTDLDGDAVGGFWSVVEGDDFTTTEVAREPGIVGVGRFPFVSEEVLTVEPGTYTLVLWVDEGLGGMKRWVPINSYTDGDVLIEGTDLFGCHVVFEVGDDAQTDVAVEAGLHHNGWNVDCATGVAIPGTDAAAAVAPDDMWMPELEMSMLPVVGVEEGQTVGVTVSGVSGYEGQELAGVLYEGGELADLDSDAVGGFWWVVSGDESASMTEVVRKPGDLGVGRFPYVSDEALTVEPGLYTLVVWVDYGLNPVSRWVPINTDGMGLFGCQTTFEVGDDAQTDVVVSAGLQPDGWDVVCTSS